MDYEMGLNDLRIKGSCQLLCVYNLWVVMWIPCALRYSVKVMLRISSKRETIPRLIEVISERILH